MSSRLPIILITDNIRSLYNVGSLFRLADGVGIEALYLCGLSGYPKVTRDVRPDWVAQRADKEIRKTGLSGVDAIPFRYFATTADAMSSAKAAGYAIVVLEKTQLSQDYREVTYQFPVAVIVGHETEGVEPNALAAADLVVHLPMRGDGNSLNVATAASAFLYHLSDQFERVTNK